MGIVWLEEKRLLMRTFFRGAVVAAIIAILLSSCAGSSSAPASPSAATSSSGRTTALEAAIPRWHPQVHYAKGTLVMYQGSIYESQLDQISQAHITPDVTPALWMSKAPSSTDPIVWQPGSVQYEQGTEISYGGKTYRAIQTNISSPTATPDVSQSLWQALPTPRFVNAACPMDLTKPELAQKYKEGNNIQCGYLIVREDRQKQDSPEIQLAVAIVKSSSPQPASDPLVMLQGGPGGALLKDFDFFVSAGAMRAEVGNRDIILIDQRGTGFSKPSLACQELLALQDATTEQQVSLQESTAESVQAYSQCRQRLINAHIDLNAYSTYNDANDIHDLITTLKLPQVDLYGVSYGTRLVLEVMRSFPQNVRSVILDSTLPPELHFYETIPHDYARVFQTMFQGCAADATCNRLHPNLASRFYSFIAAADQHPITMPLANAEIGKTYPRAVMRGYDLFLGFWQMFYITSLIPAMPKLMDEAMAGNYANFAQLYSELAFDDSVNVGMYMSVICGEAAGHNSKEQIAQTAQELDSAVRGDVIEDMDGQAFDTCNTWNVRPVDPTESQAVQSDIPTLVMEGEYDPITPPSNGDEVAKGLTHSFVARFPATGHGTYLSGQACPVQVALNFLETPTQQPDESCVKTMGEPAFI